MPITPGIVKLWERGDSGDERERELVIAAVRWEGRRCFSPPAIHKKTEYT